MTSGNPKKMKVSELRAALESRGMSSNGLKTELIQRLELAMDEEEFGSEAQEMEELKVASPKETKKVEPKRKETLAVLAAAAVTMADEESEKIQRERSKHVVPVKKPIVASVGLASAALSEAKDEKDDDAGASADGGVSEEEKEEEEQKKTEICTGKEETDAPVAVMTEEQKRAARAAKFGIPLSIEDKKAQRAKRFDLPSAETEEEKTKRLKRAERFHLETDDSFEKKKDARTKRFNLNAEEDRRLERAKRFKLETSEVFQEKRQKRLERFATAQQ